MELQKLYRCIDLQPEIIQRLDSVSAETESDGIRPLLEQMTDISTAASAYSRLQELLQDDGDQIKMLCCQLKCACLIYGKYREMGIEDSVFAATMKCFPRFIEECRQKNGRMFFDRGWWTYRQISMRLFRIGSLEYEFQDSAPLGAIAVHIPSDADLSPESVDLSLNRADSFFRIHYPDYEYDRYTCDSWLMAPALGALLPERSNIVSFQKRFTITQASHDDSGCLEWLFRSPGVTDFKTLPEDTSLQKKAKELLLGGGHVGAASGALYRRQ